jgi:HlyD family type I secretion membrane fusion protein
MATSINPEDQDDGEQPEGAEEASPGRSLIPRSWRNWVMAPDLGAQTGEELGFLDPTRLIKRGYIILGLALLGVILASVVPLESAIVAPGEIVVKSRRKEIQNVDGGTVKQILVREGQVVKSGQKLVKLDDVVARANVELLQGESDSLAARLARLVAERDGAATIDFPAELLARRDDSSVAAAIAGEMRAFQARSSSMGQQIGVYGQRSVENDKAIEGLRKQQQAIREQAALIKQELTTVEDLYKQGYVPVTRLLALRRAAADLDGQDGQIAGRIAATQASSGENRMMGLSLQGQTLSDVVRELREVETRRFDLLDRLEAAREVLRRTDMTAPVDGIVVALDVHTVGAVVKPGETVMEIVPNKDELEVSARIRPEDADRIFAGMTARINFSSYRQRRLPIITGKVRTVSADRLTDPRGIPYFSATVTVDAKQLEGYEDARLIPGIPAEIEFETGARTFMSYLLSPIQTVMRQGMREQ